QAEDAVLIPVTALQSRPERPESAQARRPAQPERGAAQGDRVGDGRGQAIREARAQYPDAEMGMVLKMDANGEAVPQPVLVGLQTRTSAEILFGLSEGDEVVTGQVSIRSKQATERAGNDRPRRMGPPPV
ncbi:unnamed protein product, partial [Scytosiphon promiscuus]